MVTIKRYNAELKKEWDSFIDNSKNGSFLFKRDYMDYHSDRFTDFSLLFFDNEKLIAVLPASIHGDEIRSHGGLTYGGVVTNLKMTTQKMLDIFETMISYYKENGIKTLLYKRIPAIYHLYPSDEDSYALFRYNAKLTRRDVSTTIRLSNKITFSELRRRGVKKAISNGLIVKESDDFETYVNLLAEVLKIHHNVKPVHTADELKMLNLKFPDLIKLFAVYDSNGKMYAGVIVFIVSQTVHAQYIVNSEEGKKIGALDLLFDYLIKFYENSKEYFDFGISTEQGGLFLNNGLISQKEGFGGRAISYDFYTLEVI